MSSHRDQQDLKQLQIDKLTWITIISNSLKKLYGLVGEALFYEIESLDNNGKQCTIKILKEDEKMFINSFFTYKFIFNKIYGGNIDSESYVKYLNKVKV